jgi:surface antigen
VSCPGKDLGYPYGRHGANESGVDGSPYPFGECTDLVWRHFRAQGVQVAAQMGDAKDWKASAGTHGYTVYDSPKVNTVACWGASAYPPFGHVAVITATDSGGFSVQEMNFCYRVDTDPGHVDERQVSAKDPKPIGFILPTGAAIGAGTEDPFALALGPITGELNAIGTAITSAATQAEADLATLRQRIVSSGQIALGTGIALAGGGVLALSALGHDPGQLARSGVRRARRGARTRLVPGIQRQFPESTPSPDKVAGPGAPRPRRVPAARATRTLALPPGG